MAESDGRLADERGRESLAVGTLRNQESIPPKTPDPLARIHHVVITGGEPMLFRRVCELSARLAAPADEGGTAMHVTIETAGTVIPEDRDWPLTCHLMSISPKLSNSTPVNDARDPDGSWARRHEDRRLNIPVIQSLIDRFSRSGSDCQLKFVVCRAGDLAEIDDLLARLRGWSPPDVLLMPEGVTPPSAPLKDLIADACLARGFRYCPRLHIELFGNRRGT